jgi:hypothetical protein
MLFGVHTHASAQGRTVVSSYPRVLPSANLKLACYRCWVQ